LDAIFYGNELLVNNLKSISFDYKSKDRTRIGILIANSLDTLEIFKVITYAISDYQYLFNLLSNLTKLKSLSIVCDEVNEDLLVNTLNELAIKSEERFIETVAAFDREAERFKKFYEEILSEKSKRN